MGKDKYQAPTIIEEFILCPACRERIIDIDIATAQDWREWVCQKCRSVKEQAND